VQSVRAVYEAQTSTYFGTTTGTTVGAGYARGVGVVPTVGRSTFHTSGSSSSLLADQVAPPPQPWLRQPGGGCALGIMVAFTIGAVVLVLPLLMVNRDPENLKNAIIAFSALGVPFLSASIALSIKRARDRRKFRRDFREYSQVFPSQVAVWSTAYLCQRCHVAYIPAGVFGFREPQAVPVPAFQSLVATVAADLRARGLLA